jgi:hypothetical protein
MYDPFELTVDEGTTDYSFLQHRPLGPFTVNADELRAASPMQRLELLERDELPFES